MDAQSLYSDAVSAYTEGLEILPESEQLLQGFKSANLKEKAGKAAGANTPEYRLEEAKERLVVYVELPGRENMQGVDLQLFSESLMLLAPPFETLSLTLPFSVNYEDSKAKFVKKTRTLKITIPRV